MAKKNKKPRKTRTKKEATGDKQLNYIETEKKRIIEATKGKYSLPTFIRVNLEQFNKNN
jgi:hypothetical protein